MPKQQDCLQAAQQAASQQAPDAPKVKGRGAQAEFSWERWYEDLPSDGSEGEQEAVGPPPGLQRTSTRQGSSKCTRVKHWGHDGYERLAHGRDRS